ncbi:MAG TPA: hypothetical protein GXZ98_01400 [Firmicutes bacterium]|jgi:hypothetical protein|nr:hypothetical protein [Bacillota bacterium]
MYVLDDKKNRYDHFDGDGAAYDYVDLYDEDFAAGSFYFPPVASDSKFITFYDDDQGKTFGPIEIRR